MSPPVAESSPKESWNERIDRLRTALLRESPGGVAGGPHSTPAEIFLHELDVALGRFRHEHPQDMPYPGSDAHRAFVHALQFYHPENVRRLLANYDPDQGEAALRSSVQKSVQSLTVVHQLFDYARSRREAEALQAYHGTLEQNLQQLLDCPASELRQRRRIRARLTRTNALPEERRRQFLQERLQGLFSEHYHVYLTVKNRFFLQKLNDLARRPEGEAWLLMRLGQLTDRPVSRWEALLHRLDFRTVERLMKEGVMHIPQKEAETGEEEILPESRPAGVLEGITLEKAFREYCERNAVLLKHLITSLTPVEDCSAPYFRARIEDYTESTLDGSQALLGCQAERDEALAWMLRNWLSARDAAFADIERWGHHPERLQEHVLREQSRLLGFRLPWPMESPSGNRLPSGSAMAVQLGVGLFEGREEEALEAPFVKVLYRTQNIARGRAVIYVGSSLFVEWDDAELHRLRPVLGLLLVSLGLRFQQDLPAALMQFVVQHEHNQPSSLEANQA